MNIRLAPAAAALLSATLAGLPAQAASGPFFSLGNTDFVVLIAFLLFIGVLVYAKVPGLLAGLLDKRAQSIQTELDTARALRDEAKTLLASYERKSREVQAQADRIVTAARADAEAAAEQAKLDLKTTIARRLAAADDKIAAARDAAVREVRDRAVAVAVAAAGDVLAAQMTRARAGELVDASIAEVGARLN
jgi:F-type H+-transporting ATPase subunit b